MYFYERKKGEYMNSEWQGKLWLGVLGMFVCVHVCETEGVRQWKNAHKILEKVLKCFTSGSTGGLNR